MSVFSTLSDHFLINIGVSLQEQSVSAKVISYKKYRSIDKDAFLADVGISPRSLVYDLPDDIDRLVDLYNSTQKHSHHYTRDKKCPLLSWHSKDIPTAMLCNCWLV